MTETRLQVLLQLQATKVVVAEAPFAIQVRNAVMIGVVRAFSLQAF